MTTSQQTAISTAISGREPISSAAMAWVSSRTRNNFFDYVHQKLRLAEAEGLTRKQLACRMGKSPTCLSHILSSPSNWTLDTVSELLVGIANEEAIPQSEPIFGKPKTTYRQEDSLDEGPFPIVHKPAVIGVT